MCTAPSIVHVTHHSTRRSALASGLPALSHHLPGHEPLHPKPLQLIDLKIIIQPHRVLVSHHHSIERPVIPKLPFGRTLVPATHPTHSHRNGRRHSSNKLIIPIPIRKLNLKMQVIHINPVIHKLYAILETKLLENFQNLLLILWLSKCHLSRRHGRSKNQVNRSFCI